jgi:futalosine hydrolase
MTPLLLVSATNAEIKPLLENARKISNVTGNLFIYDINGHEVFVLTTGVGMTATAFELGRTLARHKFAFALNIGVAGAFNRQLQLGDVVEAVTDCFADLGAEDDTNFLSLPELGLADPNESPFQNDILKNSEALKHPVISNLPKANAITVNTVHGNDQSILKIHARLQPDIETMEGAAFFYACMKESVPCAQIRSISNYVEKRNRESWDLPLAVKNLNEVLLKFFA